MATAPLKKNKLAAQQATALLALLEKRFKKHPERHKGIEWKAVAARLEDNPGKLWSLNEMERTGGEPDVTGIDRTTKAIVFMDCSAESPSGRRSLCFDREGWESRKEHKPSGNAMDMAKEMGIQMLDEAQYRALQELGSFDTKTSSWIQTTEDVRSKGGAFFMDRRYGRVFLYHNGAGSYYAARGFRGILLV